MIKVKDITTLSALKALLFTKRKEKVWWGANKRNLKSSKVDKTKLAHLKIYISFPIFKERKKLGGAIAPSPHYVAPPLTSSFLFLIISPHLYANCFLGRILRLPNPFLVSAKQYLVPILINKYWYSHKVIWQSLKCMVPCIRGFSLVNPSVTQVARGSIHGCSVDGLGLVCVYGVFWVFC